MVEAHDPEMIGLIARRVRARRDELGLTLAALGERAGISKSHVWAVEQERSPRLSVGVVSALAGALGLPITSLLNGDEPRVAPDEMRLLNVYRENVAAAVASAVAAATPIPAPGSGAS